MIWLKLKKEFFKTTKDKYVGFPIQYPMGIREEMETFKEVQEQINKLPPASDFILMGNFNARTKRRIDTNELTRQPTEAWGIENESTQIAARQNQDTESNSQGCTLINIIICRMNKLAYCTGGREEIQEDCSQVFRRRGTA